MTPAAKAKRPAELTPTDLSSREWSDAEDDDCGDFGESYTERAIDDAASHAPSRPPSPQSLELSAREERKRDYLGRRLPRFQDKTRRHAAHHYSMQSTPVFRSTSDRFGSGVDHAGHGVPAGSNAALPARERTPGVGHYILNRDRFSRQVMIAARATTIWHG